MGGQVDCRSRNGIAPLRSDRSWRKDVDVSQGDPTAPVAVLFADISGSTLLYAMRGDAEAFRLSSSCLSLVQEELEACGGRILKRLGDALLAVFASVDSAIQAAAGLQRRMDDAQCGLHDEGVHVRVGIAWGSAVFDDGDVYGDVVNVAARLVALAGADEILLSAAAHDSLPARIQGSARLIDRVAIRGRPERILIYEYVWAEEDLTASVLTRRTEPAWTLEVRFADKQMLVGATRPRITIGRTAESDITIDLDVVSRWHAEIVMRGDKFVLADSSTNGTYVRVDNGPVLRICRDEITLAGSGAIMPGREDAPPVEYRLKEGG
jgi:class 3 adenylate cyclase